MLLLVVVVILILLLLVVMVFMIREKLAVVVVVVLLSYGCVAIITSDIGGCCGCGSTGCNKSSTMVVAVGICAGSNGDAVVGGAGVVKSGECTL